MTHPPILWQGRPGCSILKLHLKKHTHSLIKRTKKVKLKCRLSPLRRLAHRTTTIRHEQHGLIITKKAIWTWQTNTECTSSARQFSSTNPPPSAPLQPCCHEPRSRGRPVVVGGGCVDRGGEPWVFTQSNAPFSSHEAFMNRHLPPLLSIPLTAALPLLPLSWKHRLSHVLCTCLTLSSLV